MKKLNILLIFFSIILFSSFVAADNLSYSLVNVYKMENSSVYNSIQGTTGFSDGVIYSSGKDGNSAFFSADGADNLLATTENINDGNNYTISFWVKFTTIPSSENMYIVSGFNNATSEWWGTIFGTTVTDIRGYASSSDAGAIGGNPSTSWQLVVFECDGNERRLYIDDLNVDNYTSGDNCNYDTNRIWGTRRDLDRELNGSIDEYYEWNRTLTRTEKTSLLTVFYPTFSTSNVTTTEHYESAFITNQLGTTNLPVNSVNYTILTESFETNESYNFYGDVTIQMFSPTNSIVTCYILSNGTTIANSTRTNLAGTIGSMNIGTPSSFTNIGNDDLELLCSKLSSSTTTIGLTKGVGHIATNNITYYVDIIENNSITLNNESLRTDNITAPYNSTVIVEWENKIINNDPLSDNIITQIITSKGSCGIFNRTIDSGFIGSTGGGCAFPVTEGDNFTAGLYVIANNITITHTPRLKFVTSPVNYSIITESSISTTPTLLNSYIIDNTEDYDKIFIKTGISVSDSSQTFNLFFSVDGVNSSVIPKTASNNSEVLISQDLLNIGAGLVNVSLYGYSASGTININGGDFLSYLVNDFQTNGSFFSINGFDNFDNSTILNFTSEVNGLNISTIDGSAEIFTFEELVNITIYSNYSGGYFQVSYTNWNTSNDLNLSLNQTLINWNCSEKVSGNNLNCTSPTESDIFNYNIIGNPHTQSINVTGYYENFETFNVTALQNETLNSSFGTANVSFIPIIVLGGGTISNCSYNVSSFNYTFWEEVSTTDGNASIILINGTYNVNIDCDGFALTNQNFTVNSTEQNITINLFSVASVNFIFKDADTLEILNGTNISINFIGSESFNNFTENGSIYIDLITPDTYTITAIADLYRQTQYILTITNRSTANVTILLQKENNSELVLISVKDKFSSGPIRLAKVTIQKFVDDAWVTDQILNTDFQGRTEGHFVLSTVFYNFLVEFENQTFFGTINSNEDKKAIFAEDVSNGILVEIDTDPNEAINDYQEIYGVSSSLTQTNTTNLTGYFRFSFINSLGQDTTGNLLVYENGILLCNESSTSSTGTLFCYYNVTNGTLSYFNVGGFINGEIQGVISTFIDGKQTFINWGVFGFFIALFVYIFVTFLFLKNPSTSLFTGTGALVGFIFLQVIFSGINLKVWVTLLVITFIITKIPKKQIV